MPAHHRVKSPLTISEMRNYVAKLSPGTVSLSTIQHDLQLSSVKKLRETLNDDNHPTTQALRSIGVTYIPGVGRGSKSYLMKAA